MANNHVLAIYDIRRKQEYIFWSTKIREIIGASKIIEAVSDTIYTLPQKNTGI